MAYYVIYVPWMAAASFLFPSSLAPSPSGLIAPSLSKWIGNFLPALLAANVLIKVKLGILSGTQVLTSSFPFHFCSSRSCYPSSVLLWPGSFPFCHQIRCNLNWQRFSQMLRIRSVKTFPMPPFPTTSHKPWRWGNHIFISGTLAAKCDWSGRWSAKILRIF